MWIKTSADCVKRKASIGVSFSSLVILVDLSFILADLSLFKVCRYFFSTRLYLLECLDAGYESVAGAKSCAVPGAV